MKKHTLIGRCGLYCGVCNIYIAEHYDKVLRKEMAHRHNCAEDKVCCNGCGALTDSCWGKGCKIVECSLEKGYDYCFECDLCKNDSCDRFLSIYNRYLENKGIDLKYNLNRIKAGEIDELIDEMEGKYSYLKYPIRLAAADDIDFLWEAMYQCVYVPEGEAPYDRDIVKLPEISRYVEGWGRDGDIGFIAFEHDKPIGAIWLRYFKSPDKGYGYINDDIPELSMSILPEYRGRKIGTALMEKIIKYAKENNINDISLSVDKANPALKLYRRFGFKEAAGEDSTLTMRLQLKA